MFGKRVRPMSNDSRGSNDSFIEVQADIREDDYKVESGQTFLHIILERLFGNFVWWILAFVQIVVLSCSVAPDDDCESDSHESLTPKDIPGPDLSESNTDIVDGYNSEFILS